MAYNLRSTPSRRARQRFTSTTQISNSATTESDSESDESARLEQQPLISTRDDDLEVDEDDEDDPANHRSLKSDSGGLALLVLLYTLQGVPLGLALGSVPFILKQSSAVSYTQIGIFSFAAYPYSLKVLWSPIVDSVFWPKFGRRKSWIIPIQMLVGVMLLWLSGQVDTWIGEHHADIHRLTAAFFVLVFLVATQDIAVDGWALSVLAPNNRGYGSTCQSIGQNIGFFASYTIFLALSSADFCNSWLRSESSPVGLVTLSGYLHFWAVVFIACTVFVAIFISEKQPSVSEQRHLDQVTIAGTYREMFSLFRLPSVLSLLFIVATCRFAFSAADNVAALKLLEKGFPKETMAMLVFVGFPFEIIFPLLVSRFTSKRGGKWLETFLLGYPLRIVMTLVFALVVWLYPAGSESVPTWFLPVVIVVQLAYSFSSNIMFVSQCGFFASISDPKMGGTYLTMLNTVGNLGSAWPKFIVLFAVDFFTKQTCVGDDEESCVIDVDGYYIMSGLCALVGIGWFVRMRQRVLDVQRLPKSAWTIGRPQRRSA